MKARFAQITQFLRGTEVEMKKSQKQPSAQRSTMTCEQLMIRQGVKPYLRNIDAFCKDLQKLRNVF